MERRDPPRRPPVRVAFSVTSNITTDGDTFSATATKASLSWRATSRPGDSDDRPGVDRSSCRFGMMHPAMKAATKDNKIAALERFITLTATRLRRL